MTAGVRDTCSRRQRGPRCTPAELAALRSLEARGAAALRSVSEQQLSEPQLAVDLGSEVRAAELGAGEVGAGEAAESVVGEAEGGEGSELEGSAEEGSEIGGSAAWLCFVRERRAPRLRWLLWRLGELLAKRRVRHILVLGCGFGELGVEIASRWPKSQLLCVDIVPEAISQARALTSKRGG